MTIIPTAASIRLSQMPTELKAPPQKPVAHLNDLPSNVRPVRRQPAPLTDEELGLRPMADPVEHYAPKPPTPELPDYVAHNPEATRAGMLSAAAVVQEFEATAKEIGLLGDDLIRLQQHVHDQVDVLANALAGLRAAAMAYRAEAARVFADVEDVTLKASEANALAGLLREKIANGS